MSELKEHYKNIDQEIEIYRKEKRDRIRQFYSKLRGEEFKKPPTPKVGWKPRYHTLSQVGSVQHQDDHSVHITQTLGDERLDESDDLVRLGDDNDNYGMYNSVDKRQDRANSSFKGKNKSMPQIMLSRSQSIDQLKKDLPPTKAALKKVQQLTKQKSRMQAATNVNSQGRIGQSKTRNFDLYEDAGSSDS